jgi:hypothetical protein
MTRFSVCLIVTLVSALVSLGFSATAVATHIGQARTMALYASARSLAFTMIGIASFLTGSVAWLEACAMGMIIVQSCDTAIGVVIRDRMKTFGPAWTALINLAALLWLLS